MQELDNLTKSLNDILTKIMKLTGGFSVSSAFGETSVMLANDEELDKIHGELDIEERSDIQYPYKISKSVNGVKFYILSK